MRLPQSAERVSEGGGETQKEGREEQGRRREGGEGGWERKDRDRWEGAKRGGRPEEGGKEEEEGRRRRRRKGGGGGKKELRELRRGRSIYLKCSIL